MDWACDQLGKIIHASDRGLYSYTFVCPTCGQPVHRKSGQERRAHFAHYSYSAKPECELYQPSSGTVPGVPGRVSDKSQSSRRSSFNQCGIYLERTENCEYSIYLKLPRLLATSGSIGEIEISSGLGVRLYSGAQLDRQRHVRVLPRLPLAEVAGSGDLATLAMTIESDISRFRASNNYFHATDESGRLLAPDEPIEWGERYRLVTQNAFGSTQTASEVEIELGAARSGWYFYEIGLPIFDEIGDKPQIEAISKFLARTLIAPRGRAYFVAPPAHHVEPDGTHVFPETTERIVLRYTEGYRNHIGISGIDKFAAKLRYIDNEWCEICGLELGDFAIHVDGREVLLAPLRRVRTL